MRMTRRSLLKTTGPALLSAGAMGTMAGTVAGCGGDPGAVEVFVIWNGQELTRFRTVMQKFSQETGHRVRVVTVGEHVQELLRARLEANNPPDVAIVSLPSLIRQYARQGLVEPIEPALANDIPAGLRETVTVSGALFGSWVKVAHKSLFWYRPSALAGADTPGTWADLMRLVETSAKAGRPPLSIGAGDGWVVTDWFENVLASTDEGETYKALARGENHWRAGAVREALTGLADMWSIPGAFPGGAARALLTQYEESVIDVFANRRAGMVFEGDFVASLVERLRQAGRLREPARLFPFPPLNGPPPLVVGGDVAALLTRSRGGKKLIEWLAQPSSLSDWIRLGGFLSPNRTVPADWYPTEQTQHLAEQLHNATSVHFDLSDQLGGRFAGGESRGMFQILPEFLAAVSARGADRAAAVERTQAQLDDMARRS
jgi:ABC-type glycerol-3-phosphate transport system substrate-binding protein